MSLTRCKYHPIDTANYYCEQCESSFCDTCADETPLKQNINADRRCLFCKTSLTELEHTSDMPPFWHNLKSIYLYPLSVSGIVMMTAIAFIAAMGQSSLIALLISPLLLLYYSNVCLDKTAHGEMETPDFDEIFDINLSSFIGFFAVVILISIIVGVIGKLFGATLGAIALLFFIIAFPASIMTIAIDKSLTSAVDPVKLASIVKATGKSYLLMCVFSLIMTSSVALITEFFVSESESFIAYFMTSLISCYYTVLIFHIMGYIVYQNRRNLDFSIKDKKSEVFIRADKKRDQDNIETFIKAGYFLQASKLALISLEDKDASLWDWKRCFTLMLIRRDTEKLKEFLNAFFEQLYEKKQFDMMSESYIKTIKRLPDFKPVNPAVWLSVGQSLLDIGHYKTCVSLLNGFDKCCQDKSMVCEVYELMSQGLSKISGYEKKALQFKKMAETLKA